MFSLFVNNSAQVGRSVLLAFIIGHWASQLQQLKIIIIVRTKRSANVQNIHLHCSRLLNYLNRPICQWMARVSLSGGWTRMSPKIESDFSTYSATHRPQTSKEPKSFSRLSRSKKSYCTPIKSSNEISFFQLVYSFVASKQALNAINKRILPCPENWYSGVQISKNVNFYPHQSTTLLQVRSLTFDVIPCTIAIMLKCQD